MPLRAIGPVRRRHGRGRDRLDGVHRRATRRPSRSTPIGPGDRPPARAARRHRPLPRPRRAGAADAAAVRHAGRSLASEPRANFIDDEVLKTLTVLRLPVSPPADDATFLRRVRLDLTGTAADARRGRRRSSPTASADKRAKLVDRLLAQRRLRRLLDVPVRDAVPRPRAAEREGGAAAFHGWVREQVRKGTPLDAVARDAADRRSATRTRSARPTSPGSPADARGQAELVSQVFLGVRLQCANCHNHPLDRWTQDDYHGLAAVFARLERGRDGEGRRRGAVTNPRTGEPAVPRIPGRALPRRRQATAATAFADWLTAPDNPYFARAAVNRLWRAMFGRGLVEPVDDLRDTNPATHPELLDRLADDFVKHGYDLRHTLRLIALSETYGRSAAATPGNRADDRFYSHAYRRPLEPEVLADALADVTGVSDRYGDEPLGTRAVALVDPRTPAPSLDILGRCSREASCEGDRGRRRAAGEAAPAQRRADQPQDRRAGGPAAPADRRRASRRRDRRRVLPPRPRPSPDRTRSATFWREAAGERGRTERAEWLEDVVWSLLNCTEFRTNH